MDMKVFDESFFQDLALRAAASPRLRQHHHVHASHSDPVQKTFCSVQPGSYVPPHRHSHPPRDELLIAARGLFAVVLFDDSGDIEEVLHLGAGPRDAQVACAVEAPARHWHAVVALEASSVLVEIKAGPFNPDGPRELAPWAPQEGTPQAAEYLRHLQELARETRRKRAPAELNFRTS